MNDLCVAINLYLIVHLCCVLYILSMFSLNKYEPDSFEYAMIIILAPWLLVLFIFWSLTGKGGKR